MKRLLSLTIALVLLVSSGSMVMAEKLDYEKSWAKEEISYMIEKGALSGYEDGTFKPENNMTKAEFYTVINQLFGFEEKAQVEFEDVQGGNWFYEQVQKGLKAGYIVPASTLNPNQKITRGEVARIISFVYEVEEDKNEGMKFEDYADIPGDISGAVGGLKKVGLIAGYPDGTFKAGAEIKRAEVVRMLYVASGKIINKAGKVSEDAKENVLVNTPGVVLKDMTIEGNLYLTEGIGEGDVTLNNVTVNGELFIKAGGENSIIIENSKINKISVSKTKGTKVRVVLQNTKVNQLKASNNTKLELTKKSEVKSVDLKDTVNLEMEKDTKIDSIKTDSEKVTIKSEGNIGSLETKKDIKVNDKVVKGDTKSKVEAGKTTTEKSTTSQPSGTTPSGGGGGGSSNRGSYSSSTKTERERIVDKTRSELAKLQRDIKAELTILGNEAVKELNKIDLTAEGVESSVEALINKYRGKVDTKERETDAEVEVKLANLKSELEEAGYKAESDVANFRNIYEADKKATKKEALKAIYAKPGIEEKK